MIDQTLLESETRKQIDQKLLAAGWVIQDKYRLNLIESLGVAVREMDTVTGPADYMLFVDGAACGIFEAKREGSDLGHVDIQSERYATSPVKFVERAAADGQPLPFLYEATNHETRFRDSRDPQPRSRFVFHFHRPETFKAWLEEAETLRARLQNDLLELDLTNLRDCQIDAISGIEQSLKASKPRALLQMATGSGKTYTAVTGVYRLAKFAKIKRALFLVDRGNLSTNAKDEFEQFVIPHDGRKFTQHYNVNVLVLGRAGIPDAGDRSKRKATWSESPHPSPLPEGEGATGRWREFSYEEIIARDKTNLDIFWLKDKSLEDTENLPAPEILAAEIVEQLEAALEEFRSVEEVLAVTND